MGDQLAHYLLLCHKGIEIVVPCWVLRVGEAMLASRWESRWVTPTMHNDEAKLPQTLINPVQLNLTPKLEPLVGDRRDVESVEYPVVVPMEAQAAG